MLRDPTDYPRAVAHAAAARGSSFGSPPCPQASSGVYYECYECYECYEWYECWRQARGRRE